MIRVRQVAAVAVLALAILATISLFRDAAESESRSSTRPSSEGAVDGGTKPTLAPLTSSPPILATPDPPVPSAPVAVDRAAVTAADEGARRIFVREIFEEGRLADFRL